MCKIISLYMSQICPFWWPNNIPFSMDTNKFLYFKYCHCEHWQAFIDVTWCLDLLGEITLKWIYGSYGISNFSSVLFLLVHIYTNKVGRSSSQQPYHNLLLLFLYFLTMTILSGVWYNLSVIYIYISIEA